MTEATETAVAGEPPQAVLDALNKHFEQIGVTTRIPSVLAYEVWHIVGAALAARTSTAPVAGDGRTVSGETLMGMPVAAYVADTEYGGEFATHWSTIPEHRDPVRLFREEHVREALARAALTASIPDSGEAKP